ncbi:hypothetical protein RRG08_062700 [Elysia crispata]|uniref:Uncharacterized protein n=1 Tax=Elysia crispata TaxID=231223 RepID=A0AAE1ABM8_9GAST|nr:hypothetical protein RRG08_062700 [Elysia crispata]
MCEHYTKHYPPIIQMLTTQVTRAKPDSRVYISIRSGSLERSEATPGRLDRPSDQSLSATLSQETGEEIVPRSLFPAAPLLPAVPCCSLLPGQQFVQPGIERHGS